MVAVPFSLRGMHDYTLCLYCQGKLAKCLGVTNKINQIPHHVSQTFHFEVSSWRSITWLLQQNTHWQDRSWTPVTVCLFLQASDNISVFSLDFDWSITNDFILSASLDGTARVWNPASGQCPRVVNDSHSCGLTACRFQPVNNNMLLVSS